MVLPALNQSLQTPVTLELKDVDIRSILTILANPRIRVLNREKASVLIGDKVPVITSTVNQPMAPSQ